MNELIKIEAMLPTDIYGSGKLSDIIKKIEEEVRSNPLDISTPKGRKEIASLAHKVARSKTFLDDLGKGLGESHQKILNSINAERKFARDKLDALKEQIRAPLTAYEDAEKIRIENHETQIKSLEQAAISALTVNSISDARQSLSNLLSQNRDWQEFEIRGLAAEVKLKINLESSIQRIEKAEAEKLELERLRAAEAARLQKERDDKIAADAAERARIESERLARVEAEKVALAAEIERQKALKDKQDQEARIYAAEKAKIDAEVRAKEAEERAELAKQAAIDGERAAVERKKAADAADEKKRLADREHKKKVNNEILAAINQNVEGLTDDQAKSIIFALATGKIPYTKLSY